MAHLVLHARRPPLPSTPASIPGYQPDNQTHQPPIPPFNGLESAPASASAPAPASAPHLPPRPPSEYYQQPPPVSYGQYPDHTQVVHDFQRLSVTSPPPPQLPHQRVTVVQQQHGTMEQISGGYTASPYPSSAPTQAAAQHYNLPHRQGTPGRLPPHPAQIPVYAQSAPPIPALPPGSTIGTFHRSYSPHINVGPPLASTPNMPIPSSSSHRLSVHSTSSASTSTTNSSTASSAPPLTAALPSIERLSATQSGLERWPDEEKLRWAEDVLRLVDKQLFPSGSPTDFPSGSVNPESMTGGAGAGAGSIGIELNELLLVAVPIIISCTSHPSTSLSATATFLKGKLLASGACFDFLPRDQRLAFRDFEVAAKAGEKRAWFRLGRDYEGVGDLGRARECFEKGRKKGDCECTYRMAMAHLLGQLHLSPDPITALPLLATSSSLSTVDFPQPAYVYGMLLAGDLSTPTPIPTSLVLPPTSSPSEALFNQHQVARESIERAAYLGLPCAQYKSGYIYEHAALGSAYDPLMSVQWYSLASQAGDVEADMSLSKWFLCGAEGNFAKNEELARTFAGKAARKGHPNGCFAMGYYYELGIGGRQDQESAKKWYQRAAKMDNADAKARLAALASSQTLSLAEHQSKINETLVRRHTQAKMRSDKSSVRRPPPPRGASSKGAKLDVARIDAAARAAAAAPTPSPSLPNLRQGTGEVQVGQVYSPNPGVVMGQYGQGQQGQHGPSRMSISPQQQQPRPIRPQIVIPGGGSASVTPTPASSNEARRPSQSTMGTSVSMNLSLPPPQQHQQGANGRYILSDTGPANGNGAQQSQAQPQGQTNGSDGKTKGPQTFAEMGFNSKPVEEEGCVIM